MSSDNSLRLQKSVGVSIDSNVSRLAAQTLFYGLFLGMFAYAIVLLSARRSKAMLVITVLAFVGGTAHWAATVAFDLVQIRMLLVHDLEVDLKTRIASMTLKLHAPDVIEYWSGMLTPILSDATVIWRAAVLYPHYRRVLLLPLLSLTACIVVTFVYLGYLCDLETWRIISSGEPQPMMTKMQAASFILSFCTNTVTTLLIGYKLWAHRRFLREMIGKNRPYRGVDRILAIFLESGIIYGIFQVVLVALSLAPSPTHQTVYFMGALFLSIYTQLSAMYPVAIVILVHLQVSIVDTTSLSLRTPTSDMVDTSLHFSDNTKPESAYDQGARSFGGRAEAGSSASGPDEVTSGVKSEDIV